MRLLTFRSDDGHHAGRLEGDPGSETVVDLGPGDVRTLLEQGIEAGSADGPRLPLADLDLAPVVPNPSKVLCVGLNYRAHILEMGRDLPEYPTLFAKFAQTLTGPYDDIALPPEDEALDWEAELTVVVGASARRVPVERAGEVIAGYTVANDVSMRTWQFRTKEWLQGKMWEASTPVGPWLVTADEWSPGPEVRAGVDGEVVQQAPTSDLVFGPEELVAYASTMVTLLPGDLILTGTPGGVGRARTPPRYLSDGELLTTSIDGLGELRNRVVAEKI